MLKMRIINFSEIDDEKVASLLRFSAQGVCDAAVEVHVWNSERWFSGVAYGNAQRFDLRGASGSKWSGRCGVSVARSSRYLVTLRVPKQQNLTNLDQHHYYWEYKRVRLAYPDGFPFDSWEDEFVQLAAHEFRHVWQFRNNKKGKGEYDAEMHGLRILNEWRQLSWRPVIHRAKQPNPFRKLPDEES